MVKAERILTGVVRTLTNPEGINQYTGSGGRHDRLWAISLSEHAFTLSNKAKASGLAKDHVQAAQAHTLAANAHAALGHVHQAADHAERATAHETP